MPVILKIAHPDGQRSAVWEVKEDESALLERAALNQPDTKSYSLITNPGRRLEWLSARILLKEFYPAPPTITYTENGKPLLAGCRDKISISHSGKMVAIALNSGNTPGIDIEMLHPRIFKISNRFLSETEKKYLGPHPTIEQLTLIWGAKEVMFKVCGQTGITFNEELIVDPFEVLANGRLNGSITKDGSTLRVPMIYMQLEGFILVQTDYV